MYQNVGIFSERLRLIALEIIKGRGVVSKVGVGSSMYDQEWLTFVYNVLQLLC